jgi:hypothetical protein
MKVLKCLGCGKEFLYAAKSIHNDVSIGMNTAPIINSVETHSCPFCHSLEIAEVEKTQPAIESIIKVSYEEADAKLKEGYEVKDTYASTVTLIKKEKEKK